MSVVGRARSRLGLAVEHRWPTDGHDELGNALAVVPALAIIASQSEKGRGTETGEGRVVRSVVSCSRARMPLP